MNVKTNKYVKEAMEVNEIILIDILHFCKICLKKHFRNSKVPSSATSANRVGGAE
jgi:hypothetical protein